MLLKQTAILCDQLAEQALLDTNVTPETLTVLAILDKADKAKKIVIPAELARYSGRTNQTLAGMLNRLEKSKLVQRIKRQKGQPYTEIVLTPKGKLVVKKALGVYTQFIESMGTGLDADSYRHLQVGLQIIRDDAASRLRLKVINKKFN